MPQVLHNKSRKFDRVKKFGVKKKRWEVDNEEIISLEARLQDLESQFHSNFESFAKQVKAFDDFPLSTKTKKGLEDAKYTEPTEIQKCAILPGLLGCDVLAGAKTGSGKTLAFLIPVLEKLYKEKWSQRDGLGALIISPTRELALQTFKVLKVVGRHHDFSADVVIGGKFLKEERDRINRTNIVICTPGRLKQHLETTFNFTADNLHVLVVDEADRILDLGFQQQMTEIAENLPQDRQTMLFSATQTRVVRDLARISMRGKPVLAFTNDLRGQATPTPVSLQQTYIVCRLAEKVDTLWSFVRNYLKSKIIIFFATCKQVRFVHEVFRRLRPGVTVLALHSKMKYMKRLAMYESFVRKQYAVLFATDIAARGLDFPSVDWVVHADCPVDVNTYIHRSGRTARLNKQGASLLMLLPSEEKEMVALLSDKKVPIKKIKVDQRKQVSVRKKIASLCAADVALKEFAQRGFVAYLKSVMMASNKKIFDVTQIDLDDFASSLGLAFAPQVKFVMKRKVHAAAKSTSGAGASRTKESVDDKTELAADSDAESSDGSASSSDDEQETGSQTKHEKMTGVADFKASASKCEDEDDDDDELLLKKTDKNKKLIDLEDDDKAAVKPETSQKPTKVKYESKFSTAKKVLKKQLKVNTKVVFDDDGLPMEDKYRKLHSTAGEHVDISEDAYAGGINIDEAKRRLQQQDSIDKKLYRDRIQQKHRDKRLKLKAERRQKRRLQNTADETDSGDEPYTDFLPDPDKIYGPAVNEDSDHDELSIKRRFNLDDDANSSDDNSSSSESGSDSNISQSSDEHVTRPPVKKRKHADKELESRVRTYSASSTSSDSADDLDTGLSIVDDEALALKLLTS